MKTFEITVQTTRAGAEVVADIAGEFCFGGVKIADSADAENLSLGDGFWDYIDEKLLRQDTAVYVSCFSEVQKRTVKLLEERLKPLREFKEIDFGPLAVTVKETKADWHKEWKKFFKALTVGALHIVPKWRKYNGGGTVIYLDSGVAFGTGEHETTAMCLNLLQELDLHGKRVADVGCGSGILALAAVRLGAEFCYAADLDPGAADAARTNAGLNKIASDKIKIENADLLSMAEGSYDVITANLTADILVRLSEELGRFVQSGARLIASGIIESKLAEVLAAFAAAGFYPEKILSENDWRTVLAVKM